MSFCAQVRHVDCRKEFGVDGARLINCFNVQGDSNTMEIMRDWESSDG